MTHFTKDGHSLHPPVDFKAYIAQRIQQMKELAREKRTEEAQEFVSQIIPEKKIVNDAGEELPF